MLVNGVPRVRHDWVTGQKNSLARSYWCCCLITKSCLTLSDTRLLCSWDFSGKNIGVGYHFLLQGIFLTQGSNQCLLYWQVDSLPLSHQGSPVLYFKTKQKAGWPSQTHICTSPQWHAPLADKSSRAIMKKPNCPETFTRSSCHPKADAHAQFSTVAAQPFPAFI